MGCGRPWSLWWSCCSGGFCITSHCLDPALRHTMTLHTIICPFIHSFFHACICSIAHSLTHLHSLTHSLTDSLTHPITFVNTCLDKLLCNTFSESIILRDGHCMATWMPHLSAGAFAKLVLTTMTCMCITACLQCQLHAHSQDTAVSQLVCNVNCMPIHKTLLYESVI